MIADILGSDNPLVRYGGGALIVFGPLYLLQSAGVSGAFTVAIIILIVVILRQFTSFGSLAFPSGSGSGTGPGGGPRRVQ